MFFRHEFVERHMGQLAADGVRRVVLADLGKNVLAFHRAAGQTGLCVAAIADDRFAAPNRRYRGTAVLPVAAALATRPDAVVVSNTSSVHAARTRQRLAGVFSGPTHCWFDP